MTLLKNTDEFVIPLQKIYNYLNSLSFADMCKYVTRVNNDNNMFTIAFNDGNLEFSINGIFIEILGTKLNLNGNSQMIKNDILALIYKHFDDRVGKINRDIINYINNNLSTF